MKRITLIAMALVLSGGCVVWRTDVTAREAPAPATQPAADRSVRKLVLPELDPELPPGKGVETVKLMCGMCHTPHYILIQPPLSRAVWTAEVTKMQKAFSGPIPQDAVPGIVDYLVAVRGSEGK